jgi:hypothetical protein
VYRCDLITFQPTSFESPASCTATGMSAGGFVRHRVPNVGVFKGVV